MKKTLFTVLIILMSVLVLTSCATFEKELSKMDENTRNRLVGRMIYNNDNLVLDQTSLSTDDDELLFVVRNAYAEKTTFDIKLLCDSAIKASVPKQTKDLEPGDSDILKVEIIKRAYGTCRLMLMHDGEKYVERMFSLK